MYAHRENESFIYQSLNSYFITAILGPRRVGKTTIVHEYKTQRNDYEWVNLNLDELVTRQAVASKGIQNIIEQRCVRKIGTSPKIWVSIDEAQKCPLIFDQIKIIYDQFKDQDCIKFILTGSAMLALHQLSAESLAGRIQLNCLTEFTLSEAVRLNTKITIPHFSILDFIFNEEWEKLAPTFDELSPLKNRALTMLNEQLIWGGLPEVLLLTTHKERLIYIADYLQTYMEKDVRGITTITDLELYQSLLEISAELTGSVRNDKKILEALNCSREVLKKYRGYMAATLMYQEIYPYIKSSLKRLVKSPKGYLLNNGLISYLTSLDTLELLTKSGQIGHRFENWFLKELYCIMGRTPFRIKINYWRTAAGAEIDFIVQYKNSLFPFEITYSKYIDRKKLRNLRTFLQDEPKAPAGFYVYMGDYHFDKENNIYFLPAWVIG